MNETRTFNQPVLWSSLRSGQSKNLSSRLVLLWLRTIRTDVTFFSTVETSHNPFLAVSSNMTHLVTLVTFPLINLAFIPTMSHLTTIVTPDTSTGISPTGFLPINRFTSTIWLTSIHRLLTLSVNQLARVRRPQLDIVFLKNPTTVYQVNKPPDSLVSDTLLDLITKTILKFDTFRELTGFVLIIVHIVPCQFHKLGSIFRY